MEKRTDVQLYIINHKKVPYGIWENSLYTPLQVGAKGKEPLCEVRDDQGDSISEWNKIYAENTGTYWIWKNKPSTLKYVGQMQYRRRFGFDEHSDFDALFKTYDIITTTPVKYNEGSVIKAYSGLHSGGDISLLREILSDIHPGYVGDFERIMNGKFVFYSNGFVMSVENFDEYAAFLFSILDEFRKRKGWDTPEHALMKINLEIITGQRGSIDASGEIWGSDTWRYQRQVFGFLSERIFTTWAFHNFDLRRIMCMQYLLMENTKI